MEYPSAAAGLLTRCRPETKQKCLVTDEQPGRLQLDTPGIPSKNLSDEDAYLLVIEARVYPNPI